VDRATRVEGTSDQATRTDQSSALGEVRSLAANRNHAPRSAKSVGTLRVAQYQPWEPLAVRRHTGRVQRAGAERLRLGTAEPPAPER
jgi:hypothetical protein